MSSSSPTLPPLPTDLVLQSSEHALLYRKYLPHYTDSGPSIPNAIELTALQEELMSLSTKASERVKALESEITKIESYISAANPVTSRLDEKTEVEVKEEPMEENEFSKALSVERESSVDLKKDKKRRKSFGVSSTDLGGDAGKLPSSGPSHSTEGEKLIIRLKPAVVGTNSQIPAPLPSASGFSHQRAKIKKERMTPEPPSMLAEKDKVKVEKKTTAANRKKRSSSVGLAAYDSRSGTPPLNGSATPFPLPDIPEAKRPHVTVIEHNDNREYYYENFGVGRYEILDGDDYSKVKAPSQQANAQQFWSMVENYIRPLTEDDLRYLQKEDDDPRSYIIPPLGRHYREVWTEEERALFGSESSNRYSKYPTPKPTWPDDVVTISPEMCAGPLTERLISSLLNDDRDKGKIEDGDVRDISGSGGDENSGPLRFDLGVNRDVESLEDRIKRELRNIGLLADGEPNFKDRQDDELCVTLRKLQADLREQHRINMARKHRLLQIGKNRMAYQEYCQVLEDTEKQIETSFSKKYMHKLGPKKSKKSKISHNPSSNSLPLPGVATTTPQLQHSNSPSRSMSPSNNPHSTSSDTRSNPTSTLYSTARPNIPDSAAKALEKRLKLVQTIGPIFEDKWEEFGGLPKESIYAGLGNEKSKIKRSQDSEENEEKDSGEGGGNNKAGDNDTPGSKEKAKSSRPSIPEEAAKAIEVRQKLVSKVEPIFDENGGSKYNAKGTPSESIYKNLKSETKGDDKEVENNGDVEMTHQENDEGDANSAVATGSATDLVEGDVVDPDGDVEMDD